MRKFYLLMVAAFFAVTGVDAQTLLSEGFEGTFPPANWTLTNSGANPWKKNTDASFTDGPYPARAGGTGSMVYEYSSTQPADAWAITPGIALNAGTSYTISFYYRVRSATYPEKMKVTVGNAATVAAQTNVLWNNAGGANLTNTGFAMGTAAFTPTTSGTYYFGFNAYSDPDKWAIIVDDVSVVVTPGAVPPCVTAITPANAATGVNPSPSLLLKWNTTPTATGYDIHISNTNPPPATPLTNTAADSIRLTGGAYNTTYYWSVVPRNAAGPATGCPVMSFTTMAPPTPPTCATIVSPANGATNVNPWPNIKFDWNPVTGATDYEFYISTTNPPGATPLATVTADSINIINTAYSTTYYWRVVPKNGGGSATGCPVMSFTTIAPPPAPANDSCGTPQAMPLAVQTYSTLGSTRTMYATACGTSPAGTADDDVWFQFTASTNGPVIITVQGLDEFDAVVEGFTGNCGSLVSVSCIDSSVEGGREELTILATMGVTYRVRVFSWGTGTSARGNFTIVGQGAALPVSITEFRGAKNGDKNVLYWTTSTEQNNTGFELQRSVDGNEYTSIGKIASKAEGGNSSAALNYSFTDAQPFSGVNYYRLKQTDKDGKFTYSTVVTIKGAKASRLEMVAVYPNPAVNDIKVVMNAPAAERVQLVIADVTGRIVNQVSKQVIAGDNQFSVNVSALAPGTYVIKAVSENGETMMKKFIKN